MADERDAEQGGGDLFDRWLAHREESTDDAPRPRTYGVPRAARAIDEGVEAPADEPVAEPDEPAVEPVDPPAPATRAGTAEVVDPEPAPVERPTPRREPVGLEDFEPVVIASVRRSAEAPPQRRGRRTRRAPEPVDTPGEEPDEALVEEPVEDEPTPLHDQVAEEVPLPELPSEPAPSRAPTARRTRPALSSYVDAARTSLDRSVRGTPQERAAAPSAPTPHAPTPTPGADPVGDAPVDSVADAGLSRSAYDELRVERAAAAPPLPDRLPPDVDFKPRTLARRVTSVLLLLGLVATGFAAWRGYESGVETDIGLAAILALATGIVWAVRAGTVPTRVSLHGGHLEVRTQAGRFVFEITSAHTRLENVGTPGRRGWRVLVHRRGLAPFAITAAMVDPRELLDALRYYRPDL